MTNPKWRALTQALIGCSLAGCAGPWQSSDLSGLPTDKDYPGAAEVVLLDETTVRFDSTLGGELYGDVTRHRRTRVFRPGPNGGEWVRVPYVKPLQRVTRAEARTVWVDGTVKRFEDFNDRAGGGPDPRGERRVAEEWIGNGPPGSVVEYLHTTRHADPRLFQFSTPFALVAPARLVRLTVIAPADWPVEHTARRLGGTFELPPVVRVEGGQQTLTWERRDVAALAPLAFALPVEDRAPLVFVRLAGWKDHGALVRSPRDAKELSAWLHQHQTAASPAGSPDDEVRRVAEPLVAEAGPDPAARARHLAAWVRDHIRNQGNALDYGAWTPRPPAEVLAHRYGDARDKASLLRALLSVAGIGSQLVAIDPHHGLPRPFGLSTVTGNFSHAIVRVLLPSGPVLTDPSARTAPFGHLPSSEAGAPCLPLMDGGADLDFAPDPPPEESGVEVDYTLALDRLGAAQGDFRLVARGTAADDLRADLLALPTGERPRWLLDWLLLRDAMPGALELDRLDPPETTTTLEARGTMRTGSVGAGGGAERLIRAADLSGAVMRDLDSELRAGPREEPAVFNRRTTAVERWRLQLVPGAAVGALPAPVELEGTGLSFRLAFRLESWALLVERTVVVRSRLLPADGIEALRGFLDRARRADLVPVVVKVAP